MVDLIQDKAALSLRIDGIAEALAQSVGDDVESTASTLSLVRDAGLFELDDPLLALEATRAVGRFCASTAWMLAEHGEARRLLGGFPASVRDAVGRGLIVIARGGEGASLSGDAIRGVWPSVGGLVHADWLLLTGVADASGQDGAALVPAGPVRAAPYAYLGGLRGVGWQRVEIDALSVAPGCWVPASAFADRGQGGNRLIGSLIGCAEGGYRDYVRMTRSRITGIGGASVAGFTQVQARLAESDAELGCATRLFEALVAGLDGDGDAHARRDRAYMAHLALDAVTRLVRQMGAMGLSESNPVQRRYRDLRTLAADAAFAWDDHMAGYGRALLGIGETVDAAA